MKNQMGCRVIFILLLQPQGAEAAQHHSFLCAEMTALPAQNRFCDLATAVDEGASGPEASLCPNPKKCILTHEKFPFPACAEGEIFLNLRNMQGKLFYSGNRFQDELAATLPEEIFLLEIRGEASLKTIRLPKSNSLSE